MSSAAPPDFAITSRTDPRLLVDSLYTRALCDGQQRLLEFARPDNMILTNLAAGEPVLEEMPSDLRQYWLRDDSLIFHHHQRGADELPHRGLKDFGSEQLPFHRFASNQAYYCNLMLIGFFVFQTFKEDNLEDILPLNSYATTVRRQLIDIAAKMEPLPKTRPHSDSDLIVLPSRLNHN